MLNLSYLTLLIALANLGLGIVVLNSSPGDKLNKKFFLFSLLLSIWVGTVFIFESYSQNLFLLRAQYATGGAALLSAYPWISEITRRQIKPIVQILLSLLAAFIIITPFVNGYVVEGIIHSSSSYSFTAGPLFDIYSVALFLLIIGSVIMLYLGEKRSGEKKDKLRLRVILVGLVLFSLASIIVNVVLPAFNVKPVVSFDAQSSIAWVALATYAITRHGLFNVKVLATQVFVGVIILLITSRLVTARTTADFITESLILVLTITFSFFLVRSVQSEVARRKEIEELAKEKIETLKELEQRNKSLAALQRVSDIVLNELDMKAMSQKILDEIPVQLENCVGAFLSIVRGGHLVAYTVSTNTFTRKVYSLVGEDLEKYSYPIKKEFNGLHEVLIEKKMVEGDSLDAFICPPISRPVAKTLQRLIGAKHLVALPLYASGEPLGVMMFVYKVEKSRLHGKDVEIAKAIADDMSLAIQRAQAFQKLKDANEYLSQLDKMKDEFISMASHELNTPLAAIEGYLSMVLDEGMGKVDAKSKEYLSRAYASSKRLAELILDLLNVSRIEQGRLKMKFSQVSMVELAESVVHELQIKADSKKIYLKIEAEKSLPKLWCDPDRIREVIVNLTGNALKFTDKGGVTINIGKSEGGFIRVTVVDTGRGIAKEDQKKLFQKFSQVKREIDEHQGTGLGLYISKNFVELHKGKIWVESEAGKGSKFIFEIPLLKEAPKQLEGAILEKPITEAQIEVGTKDVPAIIAESVDGKI
jgi:signal transduction histidine kinase